MALEIELGDLLNPLAETYSDLDFIDAYFEERDNPDEWSCLNVDQKEAAVRYASLYFETNYKFKGCLQDVTQPLSFPRTAFYDDDGRLYAGEGVIPVVVKQVIAELSLRQVIDPLFRQDSASTPQVTSETVGDHSITFKSESAGTPNFRLISKMLKPYTQGNSAIIAIRRG